MSVQTENQNVCLMWGTVKFWNENSGVTGGRSLEVVWVAANGINSVGLSYFIGDTGMVRALLF